MDSPSTLPHGVAREDCVFCLYRVSTTAQLDRHILENEKDDIPMQKRACEEFCAKMGWEIVDSRSEKGVSGFKVSANNRDAIIDIRNAATKKEFDILLVYMFDRLGRKEDETPFIVQWFIDNGRRPCCRCAGSGCYKRYF